MELHRPLEPEPGNAGAGNHTDLFGRRLLPDGFLFGSDQDMSTEDNIAIEIIGVSKVFGEGAMATKALDSVDLTVYDREFVSLIGPSGCGKTTLLNIVAGVEEPTQGRVLVGSSSHRLGHVSYMPQKDLLLPWCTALDNSILGLELKGVDKKTARRRAQELFRLAGLEGFEDVLPSKLSGGMRQRVAFIRTLCCEGRAMLLDEPFASLDALTRVDMQTWLMRVWDEIKIPTLLVTHDIEEAIWLSDRVVVFTPRPGRILEVLDVPFVRPRTLDMKLTEEFLAIKREIMESLGEGSKVKAQVN